MGFRVDLLMRDLIERDHSISYYPWQKFEIEESCRLPEKEHRQWTSKSTLFSTAAICVGVYFAVAVTCGCFPLAFFDCGWLGSCPVLGMGTLRSKYIVGCSGYTNPGCQVYDDLQSCPGPNRQSAVAERTRYHVILHLASLLHSENNQCEAYNESSNICVFWCAENRDIIFSTTTSIQYLSFKT